MVNIRVGSSRLVGWARQPRALMAAKVALAAGLAWLIAPHMPGDAKLYPYYAPFGAVISMYPTFARALRSSMEMLAGAALGIALAVAFLLVPAPPLLGIVVVTGVGVLLGAIPKLGAGKEYVPVAALFVLLLGGQQNADSFSYGYLSQIGTGIAVGLAVNLLVFPPLPFRAAARGISEFRDTMAQHLEDLAGELESGEPPERDAWLGRSADLVAGAARAREAVGHANEGRRANPRARFHQYDVDLDYQLLHRLDVATFQIRDLTELLAGPRLGRAVDPGLPEDSRVLVAESLRALVSRLRDDDLYAGLRPGERDGEGRGREEEGRGGNQEADGDREGRGENGKDRAGGGAAGATERAGGGGTVAAAIDRLRGGMDPRNPGAEVPEALGAVIKCLDRIDEALPGGRGMIPRP